MAETPRLIALLICDDVIDRNDYSSDLIGVRNVINAPILPWQHTIRLYVRCEGLSRESAVHIEVIRTRDARVILALPAKIAPTSPHGTTARNYGFNVRFHEEGRYAIGVAIDGVPVGRTPLSVVYAPDLAGESPN